MKVGIIGSTGLIGSRVIELLNSTHQFSEFNSSTGTDITNPESLQKIADDSDLEWVLLLAAKADVDGCELDKELGEKGDAWRINVLGVRNVAKICKDAGKKLLYVSTDFVFDGKKEDGQGYTEDDEPNPTNWYGYTKWQGEEEVKFSGTKFVIVRPAYPYRARFEQKNDFMRAIKSRLESNQTVVAVSDHRFCPTFIDDFVFALDTLMQKNESGIFHTVGSQTMSPYEAAKTIAQEFGLDESLITDTTRAEYFAGKADRPFNLTLKNDKINALGIEMKSFTQGLQAIKSQL